MAAFGAVYEDDDDWLVGYLASTEYGNDSRINSNPVPTASKKEKTVPAKKTSLYNLSRMLITNTSRRNSWAAPDGKSKPRKSFQADHSNNTLRLPERVNAVRDGASVSGGNMVVREHGKVEPVMENSGKRSSLEEDEEAWADEELSKVRRQSLDYDELEAVKERVMQATSIWNKTENKNASSAAMKSKRVSPFRPERPVVVEPAEPRIVINHSTGSASLKVPQPSTSGRNWLFGKWLSKFGSNNSK